ncbi:MAG TPA: hypothetical protein VGH98_25480 [Gemmatimonadaceae bacterium]
MTAGTRSIQSQDAQNIDVTRINQDLTGITENRAVSGCNGNPDQFIIAPYIGDGSPVAQSLWYDDLVVMTAPPAP